MAKKKISAFTEAATLEDTDILPVVINPATIPASRKVTTANLRTLLLGNASAVTTLAEDGGVALADGTQITLEDLRGAVQSGRVYDVKTYGAVGDGTTDDTAAIQAAISAAETSPGTVFFPPDTYKISGTLTVDAGTDIRFFGPGATLQQFAENDVTLYLNGVDRVLIEQLRFVGLGTETPWAAATGWNGVAAIWAKDCDDLTVQHCHMANHAGGGVKIDGTYTRAAILHNHIIGMGSGAISAGQSGFDFAIGGFASIGHEYIVQGNDVSGHAFGVYAGYGDTANIVGNIVHDIPGQHGMYLQPGPRMVVGQNTLYNIAQTGIKLAVDDSADFTKTVSIDGNAIDTVGMQGIVATVQSSVAYKLRNISVTGNNITNSTQYGIYLLGLEGAHVSGNRVRGCGYQGILLRGFSGDLFANSVRECKGAGLYVWPTAPIGDIAISDLEIVDSPYNPDANTTPTYTRCILLDDDPADAPCNIYLDNVRIRYQEKTPKTGTGALEYAIRCQPNNRLILGRVVNDAGVPHLISGPLATTDYQPDPAAVEDGDTAITPANLASKILTMTSSTSGRAPTVPTGTAINGVIGIGESIDWSFINTGDQTVTITAAEGHTLVGGMAIAAGTQKSFRTRCSAANTAVTYALS